MRLSALVQPVVSWTVTGGGLCVRDGACVVGQSVRFRSFACKYLRPFLVPAGFHLDQSAYTADTSCSPTAEPNRIVGISPLTFVRLCAVCSLGLLPRHLPRVLWKGVFSLTDARTHGRRTGHFCSSHQNRLQVKSQVKTIEGKASNTKGPFLKSEARIITYGRNGT